MSIILVGKASFGSSANPARPTLLDGNVIHMQDSNGDIKSYLLGDDEALVWHKTPISSEDLETASATPWDTFLKLAQRCSKQPTPETKQ